MSNYDWDQDHPKGDTEIWFVLVPLLIILGVLIGISLIAARA